MIDADNRNKHDQIVMMVEKIINSILKTEDLEAMHLVNSIGLVVRRLTLCANEQNKEVASQILIQIKDVTVFAMGYIEGKRSKYEAKFLWQKLSLVRNIQALLKEEPSSFSYPTSQESVHLIYPEFRQMLKQFKNQALAPGLLDPIQQFIETYDLLVYSANQYAVSTKVPPDELVAIYDVGDQVLVKLVSYVSYENIQEVREALSAINELLLKAVQMVKQHQNLSEMMFLVRIIPTLLKLRIRKKIQNALLKGRASGNQNTYPEASISEFIFEQGS
ncbi:hypothetical protein WDW89_23655 [Deltaproteobacteria bacterium TL4]